MNNTNANTKTAGTPCEQCPWRTANHGKRHPGGFYRKDNLRRLWNQIRKGGIQSCHPTDPTHEDHRQYAGAKPGAKPLECIGSVILVLREMRYADTLDGDTSEDLQRVGARDLGNGPAAAGREGGALQAVQPGPGVYRAAPSGPPLLDDAGRVGGERTYAFGAALLRERVAALPGELAVGHGVVLRLTATVN